jgi:hypothetical protein
LAAHDGPRVLILGNSLTADGLKHPDLEGELARVVSGDVATMQVTLNASQYREWHYLFQHYFVENGACPDYLVLNFNAYRNLDDDNRVMTIPRLASFTRWRDTPALFRDDIRSFEERCEFLQSRLFASFASRSRVRKALHMKLIPGYSAGAERVNAAINQHAGDDEEPLAASSGSDSSYERLEGLLRLADRHNVRVIAVSMPVRDGRRLDPALAELLEKRRGVAIDLARAPGIESRHFRDHAHLNPTGAARFTPLYARELGRAIGAMEPNSQRTARHAERLMR